MLSETALTGKGSFIAAPLVADYGLPHPMHLPHVALQVWLSCLHLPTHCTFVTMFSRLAPTGSSCRRCGRRRRGPRLRLARVLRKSRRARNRSSRLLYPGAMVGSSTLPFQFLVLQEGPLGKLWQIVLQDVLYILNGLDIFCW